MITVVIVSAAVLALTRVVRDILILQQVRAVMDGCSAEDRVRIGMELTGALGGFPGRSATQEPTSVPQEAAASPLGGGHPSP